MRSKLSVTDLADLRRAKHLFENSSLAARVSAALAILIEIGVRRLPTGSRDIILAATTKSHEAALNVTLRTLPKKMQPASNLAHKATAAASGATGGLSGSPP